jgi:glycosyltransferase involved in cell wall biosynthesis
MPDPAISVITPCFRQGHLLAEAIESVRRQSYRAIQHIVVNDGSDDDTPAVAARYGDGIDYVAQANRGLPAARNAGIQRAEGKYLLFLDADDLLNPDAIAWLLEAAQGADDVLCQMGYKFFREDPASDGRSIVPPKNKSLFPWLIHRNFGPPHCYFASTAMVRAAGGFAECFEATGCEDWDLWLRLGLRSVRLVTIPKIGAYYRRHDDCMSGRRLGMLANRVEVLLRLHEQTLEQPSFLERWGCELLEAEHRVRRRCLAQGLESRYVSLLSKAIAALQRRGLHTNRSLPRVLIESTLGGSSADRLLLIYLRYFAPKEFSYYQQAFD